MTYTAMILLILAILSGLIGFGNDNTFVTFLAQIVSFVAAGLWAALVIGMQLRRLNLTQNNDQLQLRRPPYD